jgi:hypothetical protein
MSSQTIFPDNPSIPMIQMVTWNSQEGRYEVLDTKNLAIGSGGGVTIESSDFFTVTTNSNGTGWQTLTGIACNTVLVDNDTSYEIEIRKNTASMVAKTIEPSSVFRIEGISNSNEIDVRRVDQSTTQLSMVWEWEKYQ